jgi:hypothetical protein
MHWPHLRRSRGWSTRRAGHDYAALGAAGPGETPTTGDSDPWAAERWRMVEQQLIARGIDDPELVRAFRTVPRHAFVESDDPYSDRALAIDAGQTISQPYVVAEMIRAARPDAGWRGAPVLEIGTGSGYSAGILAELGATVTTVERYPELAAAGLERLRASRHRATRRGSSPQRRTAGRSSGPRRSPARDPSRDRPTPRRRGAARCETRGPAPDRRCPGRSAAARPSSTVRQPRGR